MTHAKRLIRSARADDRLGEATRWLTLQGRATELLLVGPTMQAAADLARTAGGGLGASFGWHRFTLVQLAWVLAETRLAESGRVPASALAFEAVCARVVHIAAANGNLGRFAPIADRPGLPRALARTFAELRHAKVHPRDLGDEDLATLFDACLEELDDARLADPAALFTTATEAARARPAHARLGRPLLLLDVPVVSACERDLVRSIVDASTDVLATAAVGDDRTLASLRELGFTDRDAKRTTNGGGATALTRLQAGLFTEGAEATSAGDESVTVFSAPGESRECVEIVRMIHREAEAGVSFDRMAVVLRSPLQYRSHLAEAFRRGGVPTHFARGTTRPDPAGRAFLALLTCAATGLPASRFAEFLSLGEVASAEADGTPPLPRSSADRWVPPLDELLTEQTVAEDESPEAEPPAKDGPLAGGPLRAPRLWERLLVDAAVIGGLGRWQRRLDGLRGELLLELADVEDAESADGLRLQRALDGLAGLKTYALPLVQDLDALPQRALWTEWLDSLGKLATRALRHPERVLAVLGELAPMGTVGPVELREVRLVLERRLTEVAVPPADRRYGSVFIASTEDVRGHAFDVVFVPGLAEKLFPQRVVEDPIVPDRVRREHSDSGLPTNRERATAERLALRLAIGAAARRVVLSYPRLDVEQSRPRTPSFYGLEVLRAAEGSLPGFDELSRRADVTGAVRVGWPAPAQPADAIDDAEHDLSLLDAVLRRPKAEAQGMARYLLTANVHLERALRFREKRWRRQWTDADGLLALPADAQAALALHLLTARSYSPTGLQNYAACPYRFVLQAIHKLSPREAPAPLEELDPLQRGSLIHETQFALYTRLRAEQLLPITPANLEAVRDTLDRVLREVVVRYEDDLAPAIPRVWEDGVASIRADLREWLRRATLDPTWRPRFFELAFGLPPDGDRDPNSRAEPAALDCGIQLRGSIDLVERDESGALRATDHKTGKARAKDGTVIGGGETLQPVLYALALEKLLVGERVEGGSLYFCTAKGDFKSVLVPLTDGARAAAVQAATTVGDGLRNGFLPAAPAQGACQYCDYQRVCGPHEELRVKRKPAPELAPLLELRRHP